MVAEPGDLDGLLGAAAVLRGLPVSPEAVASEPAAQKLLELSMQDFSAVLTSSWRHVASTLNASNLHMSSIWEVLSSLLLRF